MPKDRAIELLPRTSYRLTEDSPWTAEHKPDSRWHLTVAEHQQFAGAIKAGVKFRGEKLDGAMVLWSPDSDEQTDFAASLINLLERFSNEGSTFRRRHLELQCPRSVPQSIIEEMHIHKP